MIDRVAASPPTTWQPRDRLLGYRSHAFWRPTDTMKDVAELGAALQGQDLDRFLAGG